MTDAEKREALRKQGIALHVVVRRRFVDAAYYLLIHAPHTIHEKANAIALLQIAGEFWANLYTYEEQFYKYRYDFYSLLCELRHIMNGFELYCSTRGGLAQYLQNYSGTELTRRYNDISLAFAAISFSQHLALRSTPSAYTAAAYQKSANDIGAGYLCYRWQAFCRENANKQTERKTGENIINEIYDLPSKTNKNSPVN